MRSGQTIARQLRAATAALALVALVAASSASALTARGPIGEAKRVAPGKPGKRALKSPSRFRFFSPRGIWNARLADDAPLDPASPRLIAALRREIAREYRGRFGPSISTTSYAVPIYTVGPEQPTVRVELRSEIPAPALQAAFEEVPLPPDAVPSKGTDANLVVWQPSTDRLWEFWRFRRGAAGPQASWGGAMRDVSSNPGVYGPEAWPGAQPWWGSSASSLSIAGGLLELGDLRRGRIDHALALAVPDVRAGVYSAPAQRSDGKSQSPLSLPEGAHLRLDPDLDIASLGLPRTTRLIAEAAQRYGIYVRDGASVVHFFGQDPVTEPGNPYAGRRGYFEGRWPRQLLATFPWERLQLLEMELHEDS